ncbi:hypothetical protein GQ600_22785 [Phytophthora cactorum]|nr:hypothetical protein GQ600_22785 [Phytophthora cactorum]
MALIRTGSANDVEDESPSPKRPTRDSTQHDISAENIASICTEVKACLDVVKQLYTSLEPGEMVHPSSKAAMDIHGMLHKAIELSKNFSNCVTRDEDCVVAYTEVLGILVELVWCCPCGYLSCTTLKGLLKQFSGVVESATTRAEYAPSSTDLRLRASYERLQAYWNDYYADPFRAMRIHVQSTQKETPNLDSKQLETPLLLLLGQFHETCPLCLQEIKSYTQSSRIQELHSSILEIVGMLNIWLGQILESGHQMPKIQNLRNVLAMLVRIEWRIPESILTALME